MSTQDKRARRELEEARKQLTREEWLAFQKKTGSYSLAELRDLHSKEEDLQMKEFYATNIRHLEELEKMRRLEAEEAEKRVQHLKEKALALGPPLSHRLWWKLSDTLAQTLNVLKRPFQWLFQASPLLFLIASIAGTVGSLVFSMVYDLGLNLLFSLIIGAIMIGFGGCVLGDAKKEAQIGEDRMLKKSRLVATIGLIVTTLFFSGLLTFKCLAPQRCYVGVVTAGVEVVNIVDSNQFFMDSPRWWRGESVTWYDLFTKLRRGKLAPNSPEVVRAGFAHEVILGEEWTKDFTFKDGTAKLIVTGVKNPDLSGFKTLHTKGETVEGYADNLRREVEGAIERHIGLADPNLRVLLEEVRAVKNEIFSLRDVTGTITITEKQTIEVPKEIQREEVK